MFHPSHFPSRGLRILTKVRVIPLLGEFPEGGSKRVTRLKKQKQLGRKPAEAARGEKRMIHFSEYGQWNASLNSETPLQLHRWSSGGQFTTWV